MNMNHVLSAGILIALAGCTAGSGTGTLTVQATDLPGDIADFRWLNVTVTSIDLTLKDGGHSSYAPSNGTFDLAQLTSGNVTTLFRDDVKSGNYTKLSLKIADATGILTTGGEVSVKAPGGTVFLTTAFTVKAGAETTFLFDVVVHQEGNGDYIFQPNASGSRIS